jgi:hypothetical protein
VTRGFPTVNETPDKRPTLLEYAPRRESRGIRSWPARFLVRLSQPMPVHMYYVITFVLGIVALILALVIRVIVLALT